VFLPARSRTLLRIVATLAATLALGACGYKGPLYLPPDDAQATPADTPTEPPPPPPLPTPTR